MALRKSFKIYSNGPFLRRKLVRTNYIAKTIQTIFSFETLLVLFLFAGRYKADPRFDWIPVDITVLTFGLSIITGVYILWRSRFRVRRQAFKLSLLMVFFVIYTTISLAWTPSYTYAHQKTLYLGTLAMFPLIACAWIITADRWRLRRLFLLVVLIASWFAIESTILYFQMGGGRIKALGGSYLGIGRALGMAVLIVLISILFFRIYFDGFFILSVIDNWWQRTTRSHHYRGFYSIIDWSAILLFRQDKNKTLCYYTFSIYSHWMCNRFRVDCRKCRIDYSRPFINFVRPC